MQFTCQFIVRIGFTLTIAAILSACLQDEENNSSSFYPYHPSVTEDFEPKTISGLAMKGILSNARIIAFAADDGIGKSFALGTAVTNLLGEYELEIPAAYQGPVVIQVDGGGGISPLMSCDNLDGCGAYDGRSNEHDRNGNERIDFSELFPVPRDFEMRSAFYSAGGSEAAEIHLTPITHLVDALANSDRNAYSKQAIAKANSHLADLFGLTGRISAIRPMDITDNNAITALDDDQARHSIFAAAFAGFITHAEELGRVLRQITDLFLSNNGQLPIVDASFLGMGFSNLTETAAELAEILGTKHETYAQLSIGLKRELVELRQVVNSGNLTSANVSESYGLDGVSRAKRFVENMNDWQGHLGFGAESGLGFVDRSSEIKAVMDDAQVVTAFLAAAKYTPVLGVWPLIASNEDAIEYFCGEISGPAGYLCSELLRSYDLEDLNCETKRDPVCKYVADKLVIDIPSLEEGLTVNYSVLAHTVHVFGMAYEQNIDILFRLSDQNLGERVSVAGEGEISNESVQFSVLGKVALDVEDEDEENAVQTTSELAVFAKQSDGDSYSLSLRLGRNPAVMMGFEASSLSGGMAEITVLSKMEDWGERSEKVEIASSGSKLTFYQSAAHSYIFTASTQDGLELAMDLSGEQNATIGNIQSEGEKVADIVRENALISVDYTDGTHDDISNLIQ